MSIFCNLTMIRNKVCVTSSFTYSFSSAKIIKHSYIKKYSTRSKNNKYDTTYHISCVKWLNSKILKWWVFYRVCKSPDKRRIITALGNVHTTKENATNKIEHWINVVPPVLQTVIGSMELITKMFASKLLI